MSGFSTVALIGRYNDWSTLNNAEEARRITLGVAYTLIEGFEIRADYLEDTIHGDTGNQQFVIQTLVSF